MGAAMARDKIRIGCGAGFADDRIPPGVEIVERGELDYLAMDCLAERTIARETLDRAKDPAKGYTPVLLERMEAIMPPALRRGIRIVTNMGAANPMGAARIIRKHAVDWDCPEHTCAVVLGPWPDRASRGRWCARPGSPWRDSRVPPRSNGISTPGGMRSSANPAPQPIYLVAWDVSSHSRPWYPSGLRMVHGLSAAGPADVANSVGRVVSLKRAARSGRHPSVAASCRTARGGTRPSLRRVDGRSTVKVWGRNNCCT